MVHLIQAQQAFLRDRGGVVFYELAAAGPGSLRLERSDGSIERWDTDDPERLAGIVAREDLTCRHGRPLVAGNPSKRLLGFAAGPAETPKQIRILVALDVSRGVLIAADADQPEWWLLTATRSSEEASA